MERKYFNINENSARASHDNMSMRDYVAGSTTSEYRGAVNQAYELADRVAEKRPDMPWAVQVFQHYRKHWVARYMQENGVTVIPTVRASADAKSFRYCFDGEPKNSIVMYSAQWTRQEDARMTSQAEYDTMLERLNPSKIFVYQASDKQYLDFRLQNIEIVKSFRHKNWS